MIYTDKLPKDCGRCSCRDIEYGLCQLEYDKEIQDGIGTHTIDVWAYADTGHRPDNCPLILIERWRLESCQTCGVKESPYPWECTVYDEEVRWDKKAKTHTCDRWQPIENNLI